ncbi:MAG: hypothetical protein GY749_47235 [Desulfobacteraceae bacterium]|nr:hypothetical protein [Desulfobacteraceae bacterium]
MSNVEKEKRAFKAKWNFGLGGTFQTFHCLFGDVGSFNAVSKDLYYYLARQVKPLRWLRFTLRKIFGSRIAMSNVEKRFWDHPLRKRLFEIWLENISGVRRGTLDFLLGRDLEKPTKREKAEFLEYMFEKFEITYDPEHADTYESYKDLAFSMTMLRPQNQVHIYIALSFLIRPVKELIRQYFNIAAITGQYDVLLKRYPPYFIMPNLFVSHGERTMFDSRGLDFRPITYKLDLKFHVPLEFKAQTRKNGCFISCPAHNDDNAEKIKKAQIAKIQKDLKNNFPHYGHITNVDIGDDGKVYSMMGEPKEIPFYGMRRARYIMSEDEMNLLKAIPTPSPASGLIVRFHLRDPVAVLMEGIYGERDVTLKEIEYLLKCIDLLFPEARKGPDERKDAVWNVIDKAFESDEPRGVSDKTLDYIEKLRKAKEESEEKAWKMLTDDIIAGRHKPLLQTLCRGLMTQVFDIIFSLWPLITGNELTLDDSGEIRMKEPAKKVVLMPLISFLKAHMQGPLNAIFSKHIDVSAATKRIRSEPRLAAMIVKYALALKPNENAFRKMLEKHLEEHYHVHFTFLREFFAVNESIAGKISGSNPGILEGMPEVVVDVHRMKLHKDEHKEFVKELIKNDVNGIVAIANNTRQHLLSPGENNALLRFIDPDSVIVHMGNFEYDGLMLEKEESFISGEEKDQLELAELHSEKVKGAKTGMTVGILDVMQLPGQLAKIKRNEDRAIALQESQERIHEAELSNLLSQTKLQAIESLRQGNIKDYAILALVRAHYYGGINELERILGESPNIMKALNPEMHHKKEFNKMKTRLIDIIENNELELDGITLSVLMEKDKNIKDIVSSKHYKKLTSKLFDLLKIMRPLPPQPMPPPGAVPPRRNSSEDTTTR